MNRIEDALGVLQKEVEILKSRQAISPAALAHLQEIHRIAWCEEFYDPYNAKSQEAAHRINPHIEALKKELNF